MVPFSEHRLLPTVGKSPFFDRTRVLHLAEMCILLLDMLIHGLHANILTFYLPAQEKVHLENLKASNRVLGHMRQEWKEVSPRLAPLAKLKKTLQALRSKVSNVVLGLEIKSLITYHYHDLCDRFELMIAEALIIDRIQRICMKIVIVNVFDDRN